MTSFSSAPDALEGMAAAAPADSHSRPRPVIDPLNSERIVIVADDLTGACDSGVAFLASGRPVRVMLHPQGSQPAIGYSAWSLAGPDVVSFTTETRNLPEKEAGARVSSIVAALVEPARPAIVFKKVDSAARGNLGAETTAALEASGSSLALVALAFPQAERTVHSGILSVRDCSGQDSRISLRDQFPGVDPATIDVLHAGPIPGLLAGIHRAIESGVRILLCDAETQEDIERLATAGLQVRSLLWAGSAGLARALAGTLPAFVPRSPGRISRSGRTLLFAGTPHPVTLLQLSRLEERRSAPNRAVVRIQFDGTSKQKIRAAFASEPVAALVLTGGDTAALVLQSLDASSILLAGELAPGIPWGFVEGGTAHGCLVITKSGGFGERDALIHAFEFCDRRAL